jgi:hypothetical protein
MSTVIPQGEAIRNAVKWISCEFKEDNSRKIGMLIQEAATRFNLSPKDEQFLTVFYKKGEMID